MSSTTVTSHHRASSMPIVLLLLLLAAVSGVQALALSAEQKIEAVDVHNRLRRSVNPPAGDMVLLTWNPRLEQLAQQAANSCNMAHNYGGPYTGLGESLYRGQRNSVTEIVSLFFAEFAAFDYAGGGVCNTARQQNTIGFTSCGHYLQLVGANVAELGCAIANCTAASSTSSLPDNMFVCEYDTQSPSPLPYTQGQPCSKCPVGRTNCAHGLCANYTTAVNVAGNSSCSLNCLNCGSLLDLGSLVCACNCPTGFTGSYCNEKTLATPAPVCTPCKAQATPCRNGSNETSVAAACKCGCPPELRGPQCSVPKDANDQGLLVGLRGPQICSNGKCGPLPPPVDPVQFRERVWPTLSGLLATVVNGFCGANATNFAACCPANATFAGGGGALVQAGNFGYIETSVKVADNQDLLVAVFAVAQHGNSLCSVIPVGRRKKRAVDSSPVPYTVLNAAVQGSQSSVSANLTGCCSMEVSSLQEYKVVSAASESGGAITTAPPVVVGNSAVATARRLPGSSPCLALLAAGPQWLLALLMLSSV